MGVLVEAKHSHSRPRVEKHTYVRMLRLYMLLVTSQDKILYHSPELVTLFHNRKMARILENLQVRIRDVADHILGHRDIGDKVVPPIVVSYRFTRSMYSREARSPATRAGENKASNCASSSRLSEMFAAAAFCSTLSLRRVPGMGTISGP